MSKNNDNFNNRAARKFRIMEDVPTFPQKEIFRILDDDIDVILEQVIKSKNGQGKFPNYILNGFANISTALWFKDYVKEHVEVSKGNLYSDLEEDQVEALRQILARAYKKSVVNYYSTVTQEFSNRNKLIGSTFVRLCPRAYRITRDLDTSENTLRESQKRDLVIQSYLNPYHNMRYVYNIFDHSSVSDKKKLKILRKLYGDRFRNAIGAALTINNTKSDFLSMIYEFVMEDCRKRSKKKTLKERAPYIHSYARAYKYNQTCYFKMKDGQFYQENKDIIDELIAYDLGYKKAFRCLKPKKDPNEKKVKDKSKVYRFDAMREFQAMVK